MSRAPQPPSESKENSLSEEIVTPPVDMAIIKRGMVAATSQVQPRSFERGVRRTTSSEEKNSQLLDGFLKSCDRFAPTQFSPASAVPFAAFSSTILALPLNIIKNILRNLLVSSTPLIFEVDFTTTSQYYRTSVEPSVLQVCKVFYNAGVPILYGENTLTTFSPATSFDFDEHLLAFPGSKRQLITKIKLEIDWADQLWAKFPLLARALGELKGLVKLEIVIIEKEKGLEEKRTALIEKDANLNIMITYGQDLPGENRTAPQRAPATKRAGGRARRKGPVADVMLKAEMKMLKDLVAGLRGLKHFRLIGFRHEAFARSLEEHVRLGKKSPHGRLL